MTMTGKFNHAQAALLSIAGELEDLASVEEGAVRCENFYDRCRDMAKELKILEAKINCIDKYLSDNNDDHFELNWSDIKMIACYRCEYFKYINVMDGEMDPWCNLLKQGIPVILEHEGFVYPQQHHLCPKQQQQ
jgi:hypothetical protein